MRVRLLNGDCKVRMAGMVEGSVGAIVCDPPYGLRFMNKAFDDLGDGALQRMWHAEWLEQAYRVLAIEGTIKAFGGSRVFHHLAAAMEDVGFVDIGFSSWGYGCLTDDTEILTESGWKPGLDAEEGEKVACWDPATGDIQLQAVEETIQAPFEGEMVSFRNDNTDQLLTPNHRVYKKHRIRQMVDGVRMRTEEKDWTVVEAGEINRWNHIRLPLAGIHDGEGIGGEDWASLLGWVWTEGGFDNTGTGVRIWQSSVNMGHVQDIQDLLDRMVPSHKLYKRDRTYKNRVYTEFCWFFSGDTALRVREALPEKRPTWKLLWGMTQVEKHAFVNAAVAGDGSVGQGKIRKSGIRGPGRVAFYQKNPEDLVWFQALAHLMNRQGRINFRKATVGLHMNPCTQLQGRHLKASESEHYEGLVWCVRVPTGAFLARRNDQVFITGNSGFPKSLDVAKALDKLHGAKRGTIRTPYTGNALLRSGGQNTRPWMEKALKKGYHEAPDKNPVSDDAKAWEGWGTGLKPAWEPVLVARKPGGS